MGLVALWAMGPKYAGRQLLEENKAQGRLRAAERAAGAEMTTEVSRAGHLAMPLRPLYGILSVALMIAWAMLWWTRIRPRFSNTKTQVTNGQAPMSSDVP